MSSDQLGTWQTGNGKPLQDRPHPASAWSRRAAMSILAIAVLAALGTVLGVHTSTTSTTGNGWSLSLHYPRVARSGLDVQWQATVRHPGGFGKELTLAITGDYFNIYETQGFHPEPAEETRDGGRLYLTFTAPSQGDTFVVDFDTYVQPASQAGSAATLSVVDGSTLQSLASVDFRTQLLP